MRVAPADFDDAGMLNTWVGRAAPTAWSSRCLAGTGAGQARSADGANALAENSEKAQEERQAGQSRGGAEDLGLESAPGTA